MKSDSIYLDHAATTPLLGEVLDEMMPFLTTQFGNPSAVYGPGREARHVLERCRAQIAEFLGVGSAEILFTSGGSESNNTVLSQPFSHFISSPIEHESIREPLHQKEKDGTVTWITPDQQGTIHPRAVSNFSIDTNSKHECLASFMSINNEIGTINPIIELGSVLKEQGIWFHSDAVQAAGVLDLQRLTAAVDYLTLSAHKMGGPKGVGLLVIKAGSPFVPFVRGGSQEQDRRAGTENVASIVGLTAALRNATKNRSEMVKQLTDLQTYLVSGLHATLPGQITFNGPTGNARAPHIISFVCTDKNGIGLDGEMLILSLDMAGVYVSAGSACSSGTVKANSVLVSLGIEERLAKGSIRVSLGQSTTKEEIDRAILAIKQAVDRISDAQSADLQN